MKDTQTVMGAFESCQNNVVAFHKLLLGKRQEIEEDVTLREFTQYIDGCPGAIKRYVSRNAAVTICLSHSYTSIREAVGDVHVV